MRRWLALLFAALLLVLPACSPQVETGPSLVNVTVFADGERVNLTTEGLLVRDALAEAGIGLSALDRVTPSEFTPLSDGLAIEVVRVTETFETETVEVPFERQSVRNEGLPAGEQRLLQTGVAGAEEITYRLVFEDGVEVSRNVVRRTEVQAAVPEIIMVGSQSAFTAIPITGSLAYLSAGNAWLMRETSGSRRPLTVAGDLDGRVFRLSPDGDYLLYTRSTLTDDLAVDVAPDSFNRLWAIATDNPDADPIDLQADNVLWADWHPSEPGVLAYSGGRPTAQAPGWEADNAVIRLRFDEDEVLQDVDTLIAASDGGELGYYGHIYAWAPDGNALVIARPGGIVLFDLTSESERSLASFTFFNTNSDWVWHPDLSLSPDGQVLYTVLHGPPVGLENPEDSPVFDVTAVARTGSFAVRLVEQAGIWAAPVADPSGRRVAYLQALSPLESVTSRYRLAVMDRDGSNRRVLFPELGSGGLTAQRVAWSPDGERLALVWEGNLWVLDPDSGVAQQLTGDGQTSLPVWSD